MMTLPFKVGLALVIAAILGGAFGFGWAARGYKADADINALVAKYEAEAKERAQRHADEVSRILTEERSAQRKIQEAMNAEVEQRTAAEAARRKSDAAAVRLRDQLQATRAELADLQADPGTSESCKAAAATGAVCADLLGQCSDRRRELAAFAESSARAGDLCVRTYEAVSSDDRKR